MGFEHKVTARFYEVDQVGIVFFGRIFEFCHQAFEEMLAAAFDDPTYAFAGPRSKASWGAPLVHAEADFRSPIRHGDRIGITVVLAEVSERTLTFRYRLSNAEDRVCANATLIHSVIDRASFRPCPVPDELLAALAGLGVVAGEELGS